MAADPTKCKINVMSPAVITQWTGSFGEFKKLLKMEKPPMGCSQSDWKDTLQKWLIAQFFVACLVFPLQLLCYVIASLSAGADFGFVLENFILTTRVLSNTLGGIFGAFFLSWFGWYMFIKRQPSCLCCFIMWVEDWKFQHLLFGFVMTGIGIYHLYNAVDMLTAVVPLGQIFSLPIVPLIMYILATVLTAIFAITQIYVGRAALGMGQEIAGVKLPVPNTVGAGDSEAKPEP